MSAGKVHHKQTKFGFTMSILFVLYCTFLYWNIFSFSMFGIPVGFLIGLFVEPDLDCVGSTYSEWYFERTFGGIPSFFWFAYWKPYAKIIPHRSILSHLPVLSTFIRLVYLLWIPVGLLQFVHPNWIFVAQRNWMFLVFVFIGLCLNDTAHYMTDVISTFRKRL